MLLGGAQPPERGADVERSRTVGAHFGLTPNKYQPGETDVTGGISKMGDAMVRSASQGGTRLQARHHPASDVGRWHELPFRQGDRRRSVIG